MGLSESMSIQEHVTNRMEFLHHAKNGSHSMEIAENFVYFEIPFHDVYCSNILS
jgi:hypothetical protein